MNGYRERNGVVTLDESIPSVSAVCATCKHRHLFEDYNCCDAFPDGIPEEIWVGKHKHQTPYEGDHGIVFEPLTEEEHESRMNHVINWVKEQMAL